MVFVAASRQLFLLRLSCPHAQCVHLQKAVETVYAGITAGETATAGEWLSVMKVIRHAGVNRRMITLDDQARQQITSYFNAMFCPSQAASGMQYRKGGKWQLIYSCNGQ